MDAIEAKNAANLAKLDNIMAEYALAAKKLPGYVVADKTAQLFFGQSAGGSLAFKGLFQEMRAARPAEGRITLDAHRLFKSGEGVKIGEWARRRHQMDMGGASYAFFAIGKDGSTGKINSVRLARFGKKKVLRPSTKARKSTRAAIFNYLSEVGEEPLSEQARKEGYRLLTKTAALAAYEILARERARGFSAAQMAIGGLLGKLRSMRNRYRGGNAPNISLYAAAKNGAGQKISELFANAYPDAAVMRFDILDNDVYSKPVGSQALERVANSMIADMDEYISRKAAEAMK